MGTEESLFTIMTYKHPEYIQYYEIKDNGLLSTFFENLKNDTLVVKQEKENIVRVNKHNKNNVALYVLTYNSPSQFEKLCVSFEQYDKNFLDKPNKFLLNNSLDKSTDFIYSELCDKYGFEEIKKDNLGICGGRQFIAEHSDMNNFDYHFFFEDDMFFYLGKDEFCRNGFKRKIHDFYNLIMDITWLENFDFLKLNFTEFYGSHERQWSWYNVDQEFRSKHWPNNQQLPKHGQSANSPYLEYKNIKSYDGLAYATGEIYLSNWPIILSKEGNYKCYIETKFDFPYEQTLMSHCFKQTIKNKIYSGLLLLTPTEHNRFDFYESNLRKEF